MIKQTYASLIKKGSGQHPQLATYRVCESHATYHVVKSLNSKKPTVGILPKCLASSFGVALPFDQKDFSFEAMTVSAGGELPVVSVKPELIALKEEFTFSDSGRSFLAIVESVSSKHGVTLRFNNGVTKLVSMRDIVNADKVADNYPVGKLVRAAINSKTSRLSLKKTVVDSADPQSGRRDQAALLKSFEKLTGHAFSASNTLKIAQKVQAKVQLVKDYGLILGIEGQEEMTGFIVNEQLKKADKTKKVGDSVSCVVMDIDFDKKIVDLSERLATKDQEETKQAKSAKQTTLQKAVVELNKEQYLVVSLKADRSQIGVSILHGHCQESQTAYSRYSVGDEIEVKVVGGSEGSFVLTQPKLVVSYSSNTGAGASATQANTLEEGEKVTGTLKSIKGQCAFI